MLLQQLGCSRFELAAIIVLEYLGIGERTDLVNVDDHVGNIFCLFHSHGSGNFVSGSDIDSGENVLIFTPIY